MLFTQNADAVLTSHDNMASVSTELIFYLIN